MPSPRLVSGLLVLLAVLVLAAGYSLAWNETTLWKAAGVLLIIALPMMIWTTLQDIREQHRQLKDHQKKAKLWEAFRRR